MDRSCFNSVDIRRMPIRFFRKEGCLGGRCTFGYGAEFSFFDLKIDVMEGGDVEFAGVVDFADVGKCYE